MKTIGIKLADGTFYPVLEEGSPKKRMLDLTTAKDNQTKVQIDLYRSENGTMEDAEYVDTLEVTKLNPHPNGEPELHLSVGLDEDNKLSAEVVDPETGKKSETEVNLVSRTEAERNAANDSDVTSAVVSEENVADADEEATFTPDDLPDMGTTALEDMPFSFDHSEPHAASELNQAASSNSDSDDFEGTLPDFSDLDDDIPVEDTTLESVNFSNDALSDDADSAVTESTDLSDFDSDLQTDTTTIADDTVAADDSDFTTDSFSLPDFDDTTVATDDLPDFGDDFGTGDDTTVSAESTEPESFDLPDFDSPADTDPLADLGTDSVSGIDFDDLDDPSFASTSAASGSAMDFSDLYDKETLAGEHASIYDEEEEKKTRTPVIICIICAIICVIATVLLLFIIPSRYNLLPSRNTNGVSILNRFFSKEKETVAEKTYEAPKPEEPTIIDVKPEQPKKAEPAPEAVEDKIVIAPEPEKVVPKPKPAPAEEKKPEAKKSADAKYHIRWGDTLWDISESYYKTPWKYPKIADYNKIKNPDKIIAGTDILIPAE